jgi:hypothetical protein
MMSEVNVLWSSAWRKLQKNLASGFVADGFGADRSLFESAPQGAVLPTSSWLVRARSRKAQVSRIVS